MICDFRILLCLFFVAKCHGGNDCLYVSSYSGLCLSVNFDNDTTYINASNYCKSQNLIIANLDKEEDLKSIIKHFSNHNLYGVFWFGMSHYVGSLKKVSDSHQCPFLNVTKNINTINLPASITFSNNCTQKLQFICSKNNASVNWKYKLGSCKNGFSRFRNKCYKKVSNIKQISWKDAEMECNNVASGVHLVSIKNRHIQSFVTLILGNSSHSFGNAWSGLHYNNTNDRWQWIGSQNSSETEMLLFNNWVRNEYRRSGANKCGLIYQDFKSGRWDTGQWSVLPCDDKVNTYICESALDVSDQSSKNNEPMLSQDVDFLDTTNNVCPLFFVHYENACWHVPPNLTQLMNLSAAQEYCSHQNTAAKLMSLSSAKEFALLDVLLDKQFEMLDTMQSSFPSQILWTGLKVTNGRLGWTDGSSIDFFNASYNRKKQYVDDTLCAWLILPTRDFRYVPCTEQTQLALPVCKFFTQLQKPDAVSGRLACPPSANPKNKNAPWRRLGQRCIQVLKMEGKVTFQDAKDWCHHRQSQSHLVSIYNADENAFVTDQTVDLKDGVWLGLNITYMPNVFSTPFVGKGTLIHYWRHPSYSMNFSNFLPNQPIEHFDFHNSPCVAMDLQGGWQYISCEEKRLAICEFEIEVAPSSPSVRRLPSPSLPTSSSSATDVCNVFHSNDATYFYQLFQNRRVTWYEAKKQCENIDSILFTPEKNDMGASLNSSFFTWLTGCLNGDHLKQPHNEGDDWFVWIGLTEHVSDYRLRSKNKFFWIDGLNHSDVKYTFENDDPLGTHKCAALNLNQHRFGVYQKSCSCGQHYFICKQNLKNKTKNISLAKQSADETQLVCPTQWIRRTRNEKSFCYRFFHEPKSFRQAELHCAAGGNILGHQDYHLASYSDKAELLWLSSLAQTNASNNNNNFMLAVEKRRHFWLGLQTIGAMVLERESTTDKSLRSRPGWCFNDDSPNDGIFPPLVDQNETLCAAMDVSGLPTTFGKMAAFECDRRLPFACKGRPYLLARSGEDATAGHKSLDESRDSMPRNVECGVEGKSLLQRGSKCYRVVAISRDWMSAKQRCARANMHLLTLDNAFEVAWLSSWLQSKNIESLWLGLNVEQRFEDGSDWRWDNGEQLRYSDWLPNRSRSRLNNCAVLQLDSSNQTALPKLYTMSFKKCYSSLKRSVVCSLEASQRRGAGEPPRKACREALTTSSEYRGSTNHADLGERCMRWDLVPSMFDDNGELKLLAWPSKDLGGPASAAADCRNPDSSSSGLWCYVAITSVKAPERRLCNVKRCLSSHKVHYIDEAEDSTHIHSVILAVLWPLLLAIFIMSLFFYCCWRRSRPSGYGFVSYHRHSDLESSFSGGGGVGITSFNNPVYSPANT